MTDIEAAAPAPPPAAPDWSVLIARLADERDALVDDFIDRFTAAGHYEPGLVDIDDVRDNAVETMDMFILLLSDADVPPHLAELPHRVGSRRARQGVPLDAFLEAVRIDFRVLWKALERVARPDALHVLVANVERILNTVEAYVSEVQQAFLDEEARLTRDHRLTRERTLSRLFNAESLAPATVAELGRALGVDPASEFEVLAVTGDSARTAAERYLDTRGVFVYDRGGALILFRARTSEAGWPGEELGFSGGYLGEVVGLAAVPDAAKTALLLAGTSTGLVTVTSAWMRVAREQLDSVIPGFSARVLDDLASCTPHERERLVETVRTYASNGSVKGTADVLFCHRNTVVNRLRTFHELTGLDVTVPRDSAWALVALSDQH